MHIFVTIFLFIQAFMAMAFNLSEAGMAPGTCSTGSVHDMNTFMAASSDPMQRVCAYCHTPHNAQYYSGPLWGRPTNGVSGWDPYIWSAQANETIIIDDPLAGPSRLCMSCHDGMIAIDGHGGYISDDAIIGDRAKNLERTHPIGFSYDEAMANRGALELINKNQYFSTAISISTTAGTKNTVTRDGPRRIVDVLYQGSIVTCSSCHDVHNCNSAKPDPGHDYNYLLWAKEEQSLICLSCHLK